MRFIETWLLVAILLGGLFAYLQTPEGDAQLADMLATLMSTEQNEALERAHRQAEHKLRRSTSSVSFTVSPADNG